MTAGLIAIGLGGAAVTAMVAWFGAQTIGLDVLAAGWALPAAIALHALQLYLSSWAWRTALRKAGPGPVGYFKIRWIRESVNSLLPVAQLGGNLVGIRLLMLRGVSGAVAGAGTTLDLTIEALTQFVFTLAGILILAAIDSGEAWGPWLNGSLALMAVGIIGFVAAQRVGILRIVEALAARLNRLFPSLSMDTVRGMHDELMRLQSDRGVLLRASGLHTVAWFIGVAETWLILHAMAVPVTAAEATVIETLGMAARSAGFIVPGALGVQETGFILVCGLFGIPADSAIALSMVKRARELLVGLPGLVTWQWTEGMRLLRRAPVAVKPK